MAEQSTDVDTKEQPCPYCSDGTVTETYLVQEGNQLPELGSRSPLGSGRGPTLESETVECPTCHGTETIELPVE